MISVNPLLACCENLLPIWLGDRDSRGRRAAHGTIQLTLRVPASTENFPWRTSIKASFGSDCLNHCFVPLLQAICCAGNYCAFLGGRNQTELYSFEKIPPYFPVSETV